MPEGTPTTVFRVRNLASGLLVPSSIRPHASPLTFDSYEEAQRWLVYIDAPLADFQVEECNDDAAA